MGVIGEVIGIIIACCLFRLAYKLYDKDKNAAAAFVLTIATVILFSCFTWFQGWAKSFIASSIISKLTEVGQAVNTVQDTTTQMLTTFSNKVESVQISTTANLNNFSNQITTAEATSVHVLNTLSNTVANTEVELRQRLDTNETALTAIQNLNEKSQDDLAKQQKSLQSQYEQITSVTLGLSNAVETISNQASQLSDVQYWVHNIFDNVTNETFLLGDTNHVYIEPSTNTYKKSLIRLSRLPIAGSVEGYIKEQTGLESRMTDLNFSENLVLHNFGGYDTNRTFLSFRYVIDVRGQNYYKTMPILGKQASLYSNYWVLVPPN
jgi:hypothetical protein